MYELAHEKAEVTFAQIRKLLHLAEDEDFVGIRYEAGARAKAEKNAKLKDLENYHKIRKCISAYSVLYLDSQQSYCHLEATHRS